MNKRNNAYNYTQGVNCNFNFYVVGFDTKNRYQNYGDMKADLSLSEARKEFEKAISKNPKHINTVLGVAYITDKKDLEPYGAGAADLLQHIDGKTRLSEDYLKNPLLKNESMITVNTVNLLKKDILKDNQKSVFDKQNNSAEKSNLNKSSLLGKLRQNESAIKNQSDLNRSNEHQQEL